MAYGKNYLGQIYLGQDNPFYGDPVILYINLYDSVTISENFSVGQESLYQVNVSDTVTITENINISVPILLLNTYDSINVSENTLLDWSIGLIFDSVTVTENINISIPVFASFTISVHDDVSTSESIYIYTYTESEIFELINTSEEINIVISYLVLSVYDSVSVLDITSTDTSRNISVVDQITITENIFNSLISYIFVEDTVITVDNVNNSITVLYINIYDSVSVTDEINTYIQNLYISINENISVTENIEKEINIIINSFEVVTVTDVVFLSTVGQGTEISDTIVISELITLFIPVLSINVSEDIIVVENNDFNVVSYIFTEDTITVSDEVAPLPYRLEVFDSVSVVDTQIEMTFSIDGPQMFISYPIGTIDFEYHGFGSIVSPLTMSAGSGSEWLSGSGEMLNYADTTKGGGL